MNKSALENVASDLNALFRGLFNSFQEPSVFLQVGFVVVSFLAAWGLDRLTRDPIEKLARNIKGAPRVLRVVSALRRRMQLVFFVLMLWLGVVFDRAAGGPNSQILSIVLSLSLAYLLIAVASRIVRNRLLSRLVTIIAWTVAALSILDLIGPVSTALDHAAISIGAARISALLVIKAVLVLSLTLWMASLLGHFLDGRIQRNEELTPTLRVLIGKFLRSGLILIALVVALSAIGVDLTALTVLSGAIGVGLGFGLQKVVSNFLSGVIILLDRSIKPGDTISVGETFGWIRELRARFVSVVTRDGREYLIPNEDFITNQVINWSFTNDLVRIDVTFRAAYDCDPHEIIRIAKIASTTVSRVVSDKEVVCWITGFGEYSLEFVLRFWIRDPQAGITNVKGAMLLALWDAFQQNGIRIPVPRRDVTVHGAEASPLPPSFGGA